MKKLIFLIVIVFVLLIMQNCIAVNGSLELLEDQRVAELSQQVVILQQRSDNLAATLSALNKLVPFESTMADGTVINKRVDWILENNNYPQLKKGTVIPPTTPIPPVIEKEEK